MRLACVGSVVVPGCGVLSLAVLSAAVLRWMRVAGRQLVLVVALAVAAAAVLLGYSTRCFGVVRANALVASSRWLLLAVVVSGPAVVALRLYGVLAACCR